MTKWLSSNNIVTCYYWYFVKINNLINKRNLWEPWCLTILISCISKSCFENEWQLSSYKHTINHIYTMFTDWMVIPYVGKIEKWIEPHDMVHCKHYTSFHWFDKITCFMKFPWLYGATIFIMERSVNSARIYYW